ncbi:hypothetical protein CPB84DRAFT_1669622, partial [Gymnopilus junonius]
VHFASTNTIYEPSSQSSSPSLTISSLPSSASPDLLTPPPEEDEEYEPKQVQIHFILAYAPYTDPAVHYDLTLPPTNIEHNYPVQAFSEPATSPPMSSLLISHPFLKFHIEVLPSTPIAGAYVSVSDVLAKLYRELRLAIHPMEYAELPDGETRQTVDVAYYTRCARLRDPEDRMLEERKGIKKIDLLMGNTRFLGLSGTLSGPEIWELNVA